jgi:hypothetical protein
MTEYNNRRIRKQAGKVGPHSMSRAFAYQFPEKWGGTDFLLPVDLELVRELKDIVSEGEDLLAFTSAEFSAQAEIIFANSGVTSITTSNAWAVYTWMRNQMM